VPPLFDPVDLRRLENFEFCRRHAAALRLGIGVTRLFVQFDVSDAPFLGGLR
jgi:hypothetical protein